MGSSRFARPNLATLGEESECLDVTRPNRAEMTTIEGRYLRHFKPFGDRYDACVSPAKWPVSVLLDEFTHPLVIGSGDVFRNERAGRKESQKRRFAGATPRDCRKWQTSAETVVGTSSSSVAVPSKSVQTWW